jgi:hypothetical protein
MSRLAHAPPPPYPLKGIMVMRNFTARSEVRAFFVYAAFSWNFFLFSD